MARNRISTKKLFKKDGTAVYAVDKQTAMDIETVKRINDRLEAMALDMDIPVPYCNGAELKNWQLELMGAH